MNRLLLRNLKPVGLAVQKTCSQRQKFVLRAQLRAFSDNKAPNAAEAKDTHSKPEAGAEADAEKAKEGEAGKNVMKVDFDEYDDYYEPQTPKEKFKVYSTMFLRLGLLGFGAFCVYLTAKELFPGRMNPNSLFSEVFDKLRVHDEVLAIVGDDQRAFGRDVGRNTEGRRNHVDSFKYKADDGTDRLRIRMNITGGRGKVRVWAEVQDGSDHDEYVYLILQDTSNGRVITVVDRRDEIEAGLGKKMDDSIAKFFSLKK